MLKVNCYSRDWGWIQRQPRRWRWPTERDPRACSGFLEHMHIWNRGGFPSCGKYLAEVNKIRTIQNTKKVKINADLTWGKQRSPPRSGRALQSRWSEPGSRSQTYQSPSERSLSGKKDSQIQDACSVLHHWNICETYSYNTEKNKRVELSYEKKDSKK